MLNIYSWNVNGLRAVLRKGALQDFLEKHSPDILCLQEIKSKPEQINFDFSSLGYTAYFTPAERPGYSGTGILVKNNSTVKCNCLGGWPDNLFAQHFGISESRDVYSRRSRQVRPEGGSAGLTVYEFSRSPSEKEACLLFRGDAENSRVARQKESEEVRLQKDLSGQDPQRVIISPETTEQFRPSFHSLALSEGRITCLDLGKFYLLSVYTPNSKDDLSRLKLRETSWDPEFLDFVKSLEREKPVIFCGDLNAAHEEIDLARPDSNHHSAGFTDEERQGITNIIEAGFIDTFRHLHPYTEKYSWWSYRGHAREHNVGWRIDYFFISSEISSALEKAEIHDDITGSDHCPISITMDF